MSTPHPKAMVDVEAIRKRHESALAQATTGTVNLTQDEARQLLNDRAALLSALPAPAPDEVTRLTGRIRVLEHHVIVHDELSRAHDQALKDLLKAEAERDALREAKTKLVSKLTEIRDERIAAAGEALKEDRVLLGHTQLAYETALAYIAQYFHIPKPPETLKVEAGPISPLWQDPEEGTL